MASKKAIENAHRLRYIRALERFHKSIVSYFSNTPNLSKEGYVKKIDNALKLLNRVEEIDVYKGELQDLQKLVKKMINYKDSEEEIENIKDDILHSSNLLDKSKNARRYKKDKYEKSKFSDWD
ncbi:MAG: hypothetical protein OQJ77_05445 [Thiovulaceae bacterium]|nr:hypothetical protein [Sulfurimonadaceae bacterium]MCW9026741.1 hypothetical protein [Sulfurimonadaceae bacterium]